MIGETWDAIRPIEKSEAVSIVKDTRLALVIYDVTPVSDLLLLISYNFISIQQL